MLVTVCGVQQKDGRLNQCSHQGIHDTKRQAKLLDFASQTDNLFTIKNIQAQLRSIQDNAAQQKADHANQEKTTGDNFESLTVEHNSSNALLRELVQKIGIITAPSDCSADSPPTHREVSAAFLCLDRLLASPSQEDALEQVESSHSLSLIHI